MTREEYKSGRIRYVQQDGNREFISLLACVCADGTALPPALIYQGKSGDLQNTWMEDLKEEDQAYFTSAANGWSSNALGLAWLHRFEQDTRHKGSRRRLLIVDGHSSHVNWGFICFADEFRILVLVLPSHTTQRLQPLDVGMFSPLSTAYSKELNKYTDAGLGWVTMTKRMFWPLFKNAWRESFTVKNIKKSFESTGICPFNKEKVLKKLPIPPEAPSTPACLAIRTAATPLTCRRVRQLVAATPTAEKVALIQKVAMKLATHFELQKHENNNLLRAIREEKKKRQRHRRLDLVGEEDTGAPQFFSPTRVLAAMEYQESKEAAEQEEIRQKALQKEEKERARVQKLAEKAEAKLQREMQQALNKEQKEAEKAEKKAIQAEKKAERELAQRAKQLAALQKQLEQIQKKEAAAAAAAVDGQKNVKRKAPTTQKKAVKRAVNTRKKAVVRRNTSTTTASSKKQPAPAPPAATIDVAAAGPSTTSRSGRTVTRPTRYGD